MRVLQSRTKEPRTEAKTTPPPVQTVQISRELNDVLELQRKAGNRATVQVLKGGIDVATSNKFQSMLKAGGPVKKSYLRTPTYRKLKKGIVEYAAKRSRKGGAWRRGRVTKLEALVQAWLSKEKHLKDTSRTGLAHRAAMLWLQPKLEAELASILGSKSPALQSDDESSVEQGEDLDFGPIGDSANEEADDDDLKLDDDDESSSESETVKDEDDDDSSSESETVKDDDDDSSESETVKDDDEESDEGKDEDDRANSSAEEAELQLSSTEEAIEYLQPTPSEMKLGSNERDRLVLTRYEEIKQLPNSDQLITSEVLEYLPSSNIKAKYDKLRPRGSKYQDEFSVNSPVLKDVYKAFQQARPEGTKKDRNWAERYMFGVAGWTKDVFEKYWDKITTTWGDPGYDEDAPAPEDEKDDGNDDDSSSSSSSSSSTSSTSLSSDQDEEKEPEGPPITVTNVSWKERPQYQLNFGGSITRGNSKEPYDTSSMFSVGERKGFGIFVMSKMGLFYSGSHNVGVFHHSSFLGGADVAGAGELKVEQGQIKYLTNKSGHYLPTSEQSLQVLSELSARGVDLKSFKYKHYDESGQTMEYSSGQEFMETFGQKNGVVGTGKKGY